MQSTTHAPPNTPPKTPTELAKFIDHTLLKPEATLKDIDRLCKEAVRHSFKAVCVNPIFVRSASQYLGATDILVASVIGFPLGTHLSRVKIAETEQAIIDGAREIDMVIRLDCVKSGDWKMAESDIAAVVKAAQGHAVKVILETGLLTSDEIMHACKISEAAGAAFVKTATGFLARGASADDVKLMRRSISPKMQIKASGGVKTFEQAVLMIESGASRLGTSSGVALVTGAQTTGGY